MQIVLSACLPDGHASGLAVTYAGKHPIAVQSHKVQWVVKKARAEHQTDMLAICSSVDINVICSV